jgi:hypothetical protein
MIRRTRCGEARLNDARLWHRVLRVMLHTRWSAEAWAEVRVEFRRRSRCGAISSVQGCSTRP